MGKRKILCRVIEDDVLRRTDHIVGGSSAAGRCLAEMLARRAAGEASLVAVQTDTSFVIVPREHLMPA